MLTLIAKGQMEGEAQGMELTKQQFTRLQADLPRQRGNVRVDNLLLLNALLYVLAQGCTWRALPAAYGPWNTVYVRLRRWSQKGVLLRVFARLQLGQRATLRLAALGLDSTSVRVHPDGTGAPKKTVRRPSAKAARAGRASSMCSRPRSVAR